MMNDDLKITISRKIGNTYEKVCDIQYEEGLSVDEALCKTSYRKEIDEYNLYVSGELVSPDTKLNAGSILYLVRKSVFSDVTSERDVKLIDWLLARSSNRLDRHDVEWIIQGINDAGFSINHQDQVNLWKTMEKDFHIDSGRGHEECADCSLENFYPPECPGHPQGPVRCGSFRKIKLA